MAAVESSWEVLGDRCLQRQWHGGGHEKHFQLKNPDVHAPVLEVYDELRWH